METVKLNLDALEIERHAVIAVYNNQLEAFRSLKKEMERVKWADDRYDRAVDSLNEIGKALASALQSLTNGHDVYVISDMIPLANKYVDNARYFPRLKG